MTCIVGIAQGGKVSMGGDSAGVSGWDLTIREDPKVFERGPFLIGFTSSFRMGQLLRYQFTPPAHHPSDMDDFEFMATLVVDAIRSCFQTGGYAKKESDQESAGTFLIGYRGRLYAIHSDYQVELSADGYNAVGSGNSPALGALWATRADPDAERRLITALEAAERHNIGVRGPFVIIEGASS